MSFLAGFIYRQFFHQPPAPKACFEGKTVIVTGASSGLGLEACRSMVRLGALKVILACRNLEKGKLAMEDIAKSTSCSPETLEIWDLDLSSYASVQAFANRAEVELRCLDVVLANAGLATKRFEVTEDNEETITTNVVSMSLLAFLLHPKLHETAAKYGTQTHFTVTASELYEVAKFKERQAPTGQLFATLNDEGTSNMGDRYNVSKLMGIFVVKQIAALLPFASSGVIVNCVAPGFCHSELLREHDSIFAFILKKLLCRPTEVGARTLVYGASVGPESHGQYVPDCVITATRGLTKGKAGEELQNRIWVELREKLEGFCPGVTFLG